MSDAAETNQGQAKFHHVFQRNPAHCRKLIVCVHGMGDQLRNEMASSVASLWVRGYVDELGLKDSRQVIRLPQGLWEGKGGTDAVQDDVIGYVPTAVAAVAKDVFKPLREVAFGEVYWADLPRGVSQTGHRLQDSPKWAGSVVDRLRQRHGLAKDFTGEGAFSENDLTLGATVVEEIAETIQILNRLLFLTDKAGMFTFDLGNILEQYLGDVQ